MSTAQWLITAFSIGSAAGSIPMMKIQSQYGFRKSAYIFLTVLVLLYTISYFLVNYYPVLIMVRLIIGYISSGLHGFRNATCTLYTLPELS